MQKSSNKAPKAAAAPSKESQAIRIMAIKLSSIRSKVEQAILWLESHNGPIIRRMFPKVSQVIELLKEILVVISEKPVQSDPV